MSYIIRLVSNPEYVLGCREVYGTIDTTVDTHSSDDTNVYMSVELAKRALRIHLAVVPSFLFEIHELPRYVLDVCIGDRWFTVQNDDSLQHIHKSTSAKRFMNLEVIATYKTKYFDGYTTKVSYLESEF